MRKRFLMGMIIGLISVTGLASDFKVANIFSDDMVLQRNAPVPVWGWTRSGATVTVSFKGQTLSAVADIDGEWMVKLAPMEASAAPAEMKTQTDEETITFKNVVVGDVWLCSGQSNMAFRLKQVPDGKQQVATADHPLIRLFQVNGGPADLPLYDVQSEKQWRVCDPESAKNFSAVGYFFGRTLQAALKVPIGLINNAVGASFAESWTSREALQATKELKPILERHIELMDVKAFERRLKEWRKNVAEWKKIPKEEKRKRPVVIKWWRRIRRPYGYPGDHRPPSYLFNARINPLIPFAIKGVIWYQGESNVPCGKEYGVLFPTLIQDWRTRWGQGDFPFYFVQIAPCHEFKEMDLPTLWTSQYETAANVANCDFTSPIDYGDVTDPHPTEKQPVGERLAALALAETYKKPGPPHKCPRAKSMAVENGKARILFDHLNGQGLVSRDGKPLSWFRIAGKDGEFHDAEAVIDGDTVVVSSSDVEVPTAVSFAWDGMAEPNLNGGNGLPVLPFHFKRESNGQ